MRIRSITWEEGTEQFTYWLYGLGRDVPEDELSLGPVRAAKKTAKKKRV
jgi:hypothetical protein